MIEEEVPMEPPVNSSILLARGSHLLASLRWDLSVGSASNSSEYGVYPRFHVTVLDFKTH